MAKNTMMKLYYNGGVESAKAVASDYQKANNLWSRLKSKETPEEWAELINEHLDEFFEMNSTGTWEDAMVWIGIMGFYDAQRGLQHENGHSVSIFIDGFKLSKASSYAKNTLISAYYTLRDQRVTRS